VQRFGSGNLHATPGTNFRYSNMDYLILGAIIEKVTGKKWERVLEEKILKPLNLKSTGVDLPDLKLSQRALGYYKQGDSYYPDPQIYMPNLQAAASMYGTVEDLFKWNQALYAKPNRLLSQKSLELMVNDKNKPLFHLGYVGYANWIYPKEVNTTKKLVVHERRGEVGGFHSSLLRIIDNKQTIIVLSNVGSSDSVGTLYEITSQIARIMNN
jgi:CubicO group peptidase (beta-lactamase class C family)